MLSKQVISLTSMKLSANHICTICTTYIICFSLFRSDASLFRHTRYEEFINYPVTGCIRYAFLLSLLFVLLSCCKVRLWVSALFGTTGIRQKMQQYHTSNIQSFYLLFVMWVSTLFNCVTKNKIYIKLKVRLASMLNRLI